MELNPIYHEYKRLVDESLEICESPNPKILKADVCNEIRDDFFVIAPNTKNRNNVFYVESDHNFVIEARRKFLNCNIIEGDIRDLVFRDEFFDVILDLSTIDHVENYRAVIGEYFRCLKKGGILLLIVWLDDKTREINGQWYFERDEFYKSIFFYYFNLVKEEIFPNAMGGDGILTAFVCRK